MRVRSTLLVLAATLASGSAWTGEWQFKERKDPIDDTLEYTAWTAYEDGIRSRILGVRCETSRLQVVVEYDRFLTDSSVIYAQYRFGDAVPQGKVLPMSVTGTAVMFSDRDSIDVARKLATDRKFAMRIEDHKGIEDTVVFDLKGSKQPIGKVIENCSSKPLQMANGEVEAINGTVRSEVEGWTKVDILKAKELLTKLGFFEGQLNPDLVPELFISANRFVKSFMYLCRTGQVVWSEREACAIEGLGSILLKLEAAARAKRD